MCIPIVVYVIDVLWLCYTACTYCPWCMCIMCMLHDNNAMQLATRSYMVMKAIQLATYMDGTDDANSIQDGILTKFSMVLS